MVATIKLNLSLSLSLLFPLSSSSATDPVRHYSQSHPHRSLIAAQFPSTFTTNNNTNNPRERVLPLFPTPSPKRFLLFQDANSTLWATMGHRQIHLSAEVYGQASSKVEETVKNLKENAKVEAKEKTEAAAAAAAASIPGVIPTTETPATSTGKSSTPTSTTPPASAAESTMTITPPTTAPATVAVKKSLKQRIWDEVVHYYHGFRLLGIDVKISVKLLWKTLNGEKLTRRENKLLVRTTSDVFRLVPFSVFIIVPFMELLLPVFIKFFPGMLPSTFQTAKDRDEKLKQNLKVKLEMAKFLQKTLDEMAVQHQDHRSEAAKQFSEFVKRTKDGGEMTTGDEILKFSKLFEDEMTLDSLNRDQLMALCRVIDVPTLGTNNFLRFQLQLKLRSLMADDKIIQKESVDSLNLPELQAASRARGMRAYGMSMDHLKYQLEEWIHLSVNERVPPVLLLLSRAMLLPENIPTSDKLKATISALPDTVVTQTKAAIGEREGKIDNRTKIEIIQEEVRKIKEEDEEEKEIVREQKEKLEDQAQIIAQEAEQELKDTAQVLTTDTKEEVLAKARVAQTMAKAAAQAEGKKAPVAAAQEGGEISSRDLEVLSDALGALAKDKKTLLVEKEEIRDLKEEIADYVEDVKELNEVVTPQDQIHESTGAKLLLRKVDSMISKLDKVLDDLEKKEKAIKQATEGIVEGAEGKREELIHIDELMSMIRKVQKIGDNQKLDSIEKLLGKLDLDQDGHLKVDDLLEVSSVGRGGRDGQVVNGMVSLAL